MKFYFLINEKIYLYIFFKEVALQDPYISGEPFFKLFLSLQWQLFTSLQNSISIQTNTNLYTYIITFLSTFSLFLFNIFKYIISDHPFKQTWSYLTKHSKRCKIYILHNTQHIVRKLKYNIFFLVSTIQNKIESQNISFLVVIIFQDPTALKSLIQFWQIQIYHSIPCILILLPCLLLQKQKENTIYKFKRLLKTSKTHIHTICSQESNKMQLQVDLPIKEKKKETSQHPYLSLLLQQ
eukprot:TRINITY_DN6677_c0_g1_i4.p2 TRINITY_DN6677_c0_g1~~TRINITY_DN6677_c0_g1_i4.p2  ORF type:complete len:238 (+),score=-19.42 TRINITY_DN6677_c0_g1_i4:2783-3496(+)